MSRVRFRGPAEGPTPGASSIARALLPRLKVLCVLGVGGLGLCSCGGAADNGVAKLKPAAILATARAAAARASSVHASGSIGGGSSKTVFDLDLLAGRGGSGQLIEGPLGFALIEIGRAVYIKGSPAFYARFAGPAVASTLVGRWFKASTRTAGFSGLATLTTQRRLVATALHSVGALSVGGTATVSGHKVVRVRAADGATYDIASTGTPYPVEVTKSGVAGGTIIFTNWSRPVKLAAPPRPVDIRTLSKASATAVG